MSDAVKARLVARLAMANAIAGQSKRAAQRLAAHAGTMEEGHLSQIGELRKKIQAAGVGTDNEAEQDYCRLLLERHRIAQAGELSARDAERFPDLAGDKVQKGLGSASHAYELMGRWYRHLYGDEASARAADDELYRIDLEEARDALGMGPRFFVGWLGQNTVSPVGAELAAITTELARNEVIEATLPGNSGPIPPGPPVEATQPLEAQESDDSPLEQWITGSKVVGPQGSPLVVYPYGPSVLRDDGRPSPATLSPDRNGPHALAPEETRHEALYGTGFYFTDSVAAAADVPVEPNRYRLSRDLTEDDLETAGRYLAAQSTRNVHGAEVDSALAVLQEGRAAFGAYLTKRGPGIKADLLGALMLSHSPVAPTAEVYGLYLRVVNPWDADAPMTAELGRAFLETLPDHSPMRGYDFTFERGTRGEFQSKMVRTPEDEPVFLETLRRLGLDGITYLAGGAGSEGDHRVWIVWSMTQVKAVENFGGFDPSEDLYKGVPREWVPPDMPRWQKGPIAPGALLPLNGVEDRNKFGAMLDTMRAGSWTWDAPLVRSGDQLITGSHRYNAARAAGLKPPTVTLDSVFREAGLDFRKLWGENSVPLVSWVSNLCAILPFLPPELVQKYGIDLG